MNQSSTFCLETMGTAPMDQRADGRFSCWFRSLHDGIVNAERYIQVLEQKMLPSRQQDNNKPHSAVQVLNWLLADQNPLKMLFWSI